MHCQRLLSQHVVMGLKPKCFSLKLHFFYNALYCYAFSFIIHQAEVFKADTAVSALFYAKCLEHCLKSSTLSVLNKY